MKKVPEYYSYIRENYFIHDKLQQKQYFFIIFCHKKLYHPIINSVSCLVFVKELNWKGRHLNIPNYSGFNENDWHIVKKNDI